MSEVSNFEAISSPNYSSIMSSLPGSNAKMPTTNPATLNSSTTTVRSVSPMNVPEVAVGDLASKMVILV